jgi:hypothetical protein
MTRSYDVPQASATWVEPTGQTEYTLTWLGTDLHLSGVNLNDGTEWESPTPVEEPERFGPVTTVPEFYAWAAKFTSTPRVT